VVRIVDGSAPDGDGSPLAAPGFGTELIDDEGVEVQNTVLVDGGHIVGMMHSRETAHRYGVAPTGNGFSELGDRRIVRMRNTVLCPERGRPLGRERSTSCSRGRCLGVVLHGSLGGAVSKEGMSLVDAVRATSCATAGSPARSSRRGTSPRSPSGCLQTVEGYAGPVDATAWASAGRTGSCGG
jgi:hypothetical protein